jgi:NADPH:quinone reductase-like Zn-dependent oxidoreductase
MRLQAPRHALTRVRSHNRGLIWHLPVAASVIETDLEEAAIAGASSVFRAEARLMTSKAKLKKLNEQVVVITDASSGIGMETAQLAARQGAKVILNGRDERALKEITARIRNHGGEAEYFVAM